MRITVVEETWRRSVGLLSTNRTASAGLCIRNSSSRVAKRMLPFPRMQLKVMFSVSGNALPWDQVSPFSSDRRIWPSPNPKAVWSLRVDVGCRRRQSIPEVVGLAGRGGAGPGAAGAQQAADRGRRGGPEEASAMEEWPWVHGSDEPTGSRGWGDRGPLKMHWTRAGCPCPGGGVRLPGVAVFPRSSPPASGVPLSPSGPVATISSEPREIDGVA